MAGTRTNGADFVNISHGDTRGVFFVHETDAKSSRIIIRGNRSGREMQRIDLDDTCRVGNVYACYAEGLPAYDLSYTYIDDGTEVTDKRARAFAVKRTYGTRSEGAIPAIIPNSDFDWGDDKRPAIAYNESIWYLIHVRGFTKSSSSGVKNKGTFEGVAEKIPYLNSLGITALEMQPIYEFEERELPSDIKDAASISVPPAGRINYWGYKRGYYFAPKGAYAAGEDACASVKSMVKALHAAGIEVILQFWFEKNCPESEILEILRYWAAEYHIDGFRLMGETIPMHAVASDPVLSSLKIVSDHVEGLEDKNKRIAFSADDYLFTIRKLLKGDEGMVGGSLKLLRANPSEYGRVNYITSYRGFTLCDLVSYDRKHNEENGEDGRDGNDFNFSWNCGEEGPTRKKKVRDLRIRQIKNALSLLMLGAGTPEIFMGDEFANSQKGNNNPYCLDNAVTWLDWKDAAKNSDITDYFRFLVTLRRDNPVIHMPSELTLMDRESCGYPDLSYHGESAWKANTESFSRSFGLMYCGAYASGDGKITSEDAAESLLYIGVNMHWDVRKLALPKLPKGYRWTLISSTGSEPVCDEEDHTISLPSRCICFYGTSK